MKTYDMYIPEAVDTPARKAKRRSIKYRRIAEGFAGAGKYALVSILTVLVAVPSARLAVFVLAANFLLIGVAIGCALRWRAS